MWLVYARNRGKSKTIERVKISDEKRASINLKRHKFHGDWNGSAGVCQFRA
jgi:hypothetical protein